MARMMWWAAAALLGTVAQVGLARAIMATGWLPLAVFLVGCAGLWVAADAVWSLRRAHR